MKIYISFFFFTTRKYLQLGTYICICIYIKWYLKTIDSMYEKFKGNNFPIIAKDVNIFGYLT